MFLATGTKMSVILQSLVVHLYVVQFICVLRLFPMQAYLTDFLRSFSTLPYYATFSQHHTDVERQILGVVGISV